jgi:hypothetical protein
VDGPDPGLVAVASDAFRLAGIRAASTIDAKGDELESRARGGSFRIGNRSTRPIPRG